MLAHTHTHAHMQRDIHTYTHAFCQTLNGFWFKMYCVMFHDICTYIYRSIQKWIEVTSVLMSVLACNLACSVICSAWRELTHTIYLRYLTHLLWDQAEGDIGEIRTSKRWHFSSRHPTPRPWFDFKHVDEYQRQSEAALLAQAQDQRISRLTTSFCPRCCSFQRVFAFTLVPKHGKLWDLLKINRFHAWI